MGLRLRMKSSYDCSGFSEPARVVCAGLMRHGMMSRATAPIGESRERPIRVGTTTHRRPEADARRRLRAGRNGPEPDVLALREIFFRPLAHRSARAVLVSAHVWNFAASSPARIDRAKRDGWRAISNFRIVRMGFPALAANSASEPERAEKWSVY
jgi:hypothetical protein